jgi:SAM-dependent methyltransferase
MAIVDHVLEYLLSLFCRSPESVAADSSEVAEDNDPRSALRRVIGAYPELETRITNARVLDFGCGLGYQAVALAELGALSVLGVDMNPEWLSRARRLATERGVADRVRFVESLGPKEMQKFDVVISQNSMEHFPDPERALSEMIDALAPNGEIILTFEPPWYAPYGAHMHYFTKIPWVHLLFPERTIMAVRARYKNDGARRYEDVEGGLNRMSVHKFDRLLRSSGLSVVRRTNVPVKGQLLLSRIPGVRELFTNRLTAVLRHR